MYSEGSLNRVGSPKARPRNKLNLGQKIFYFTFFSVLIGISLISLLVFDSYFFWEFKNILKNKKPSQC